MPDITKALNEEFVRSGATAFPGSSQVQGLSWSVATHMAHDVGPQGPWREPFGSFFYVATYHTNFDPDWPIVTDWPAVVRGLRGSLHVSQLDFADLCGLGRATVERWEAKRAVPFGGNALQLLTLVRDQLKTPVQAGQALNLAAAAVLPHITRPTAQYLGEEITSWLRLGKHDHSDLGRPLLQALVSARILVPIDPGDDELEDLYLPLPGRLRPPTEQPDWATGLIADLQRVSTSDRQLVVDLAHRLVGGGPGH